MHHEHFADGGEGIPDQYARGVMRCLSMLGIDMDFLITEQDRKVPAMVAAAAEFTGNTVPGRTPGICCVWSRTTLYNDTSIPITEAEFQDAKDDLETLLLASGSSLSLVKCLFIDWEISDGSGGPLSRAEMLASIELLVQNKRQNMLQNAQAIFPGIPVYCSLSGPITVPGRTTEPYLSWNAGAPLLDGTPNDDKGIWYPTNWSINESCEDWGTDNIGGEFYRNSVPELQLAALEFGLSIPPLEFPYQPLFTFGHDGTLGVDSWIRNAATDAMLPYMETYGRWVADHAAPNRVTAYGMYPCFDLDDDDAKSAAHLERFLLGLHYDPGTDPEPPPGPSDNNLADTLANRLRGRAINSRELYLLTGGRVTVNFPVTPARSPYIAIWPLRYAGSRQAVLRLDVFTEASRDDEALDGYRIMDLLSDLFESTAFEFFGSGLFVQRGDRRRTKLGAEGLWRVSQEFTARSQTHIEQSGTGQQFTGSSKTLPPPLPEG